MSVEYTRHTRPVGEVWMLYEHITTPRPAWNEGEAGRRRALERAVKRVVIGGDCTLTDGRKVCRDNSKEYTLWKTDFQIEGHFSCRARLLDYLLELPARVPKPRKPRVSASGWYGVRQRGQGKYQARVRFEDADHHIGTFRTPEDAARAYDAFVIEHGLKRPLNFPAGEEAA